MKTRGRKLIIQKRQGQGIDRQGPFENVEQVVRAGHVDVLDDALHESPLEGQGSQEQDGHVEVVGTGACQSNERVCVCGGGGGWGIHACD